jgi:replicative DNA helicase
MSIEQTELKWFKSIRNDRDLIDDSQVFAMSEPFRRVELNKLLEFFRTYSKDSKTLRSAYKLSLDRLSTIYPKNQIRAEINNSTGFKSSVTSYEEDLINDFSKRKLFETSYEVLSLEEEPDSNVLMDKFKTTIDLIQDNTVANDQMTKADAVNLIHEKWARLYTGDYSDYLRTGIQDLDDTIIGFQKKTLIVPCARPSFGKTALALTIMENMVYAGHKCAFISVEMTKDQLMERLAFIKSEIPSDVFFEGTVTDTDRHQKDQER